MGILDSIGSALGDNFLGDLLGSSVSTGLGALVGQATADAQQDADRETVQLQQQGEANRLAQQIAANREELRTRLAAEAALTAEKANQDAEMQRRALIARAFQDLIQTTQTGRTGESNALANIASLTQQGIR